MRCRSAVRSASEPARYARRDSTAFPTTTRNPIPSSTPLPALSRDSSTTPDGATTPTTSPLRIRIGFAIGAGVKLASPYRLTPRLSTKSCKDGNLRLFPQPMRPPALQIARVADALLRRLVEADVLTLDAPVERVKERFVALLTKNFDDEDEIEREAVAEAEKLVRQGAPGVRREDLDLRRVEQLVKQRIAKARGFAL
jgi:hypothetical protein